MNEIIAILIPIHNGLEYTQKCLKNLYDEIGNNVERKVKYEIVVIDDGSTDGSSKWISEHYPNLHLLKGDGNLWWSGAINKGAKYSIEELKTDYILLWNNDISTHENYFDNLTQYILSDQSHNSTITGSKIYSDYKNKIIWSLGGKFNSKNGDKFMIGQGKLEKTLINPLPEPNWLTGMGTLIPKYIIEKIGYWNEKTFPQYFGDSEFTLRAFKRGIKIQILPKLIIENDISNTGLKHKDSFTRLIRSFYDRRSLHNVKYSFAFYKRFASSPFAYLNFLSNYFRYIGGFIKWKLLKLFGKTRN